MANEQRLSPVRALMVGAALAWACATTTACEALELSTRRVGSFYITGNGMDDGFDRWLATLSPEERAVIDKLMARKDLVIHIILKVGYLDPGESRTGASYTASSDRAKRACFWHPKIAGVPWQRDWELIYDRQLAEEFESRYGILSPPEVTLHHEFFGHILLILNDPKLVGTNKSLVQLEAATEPGAVLIENRYRKRLGLREVPWKLLNLSPP